MRPLTKKNIFTLYIMYSSEESCSPSRRPPRRSGGSRSDVQTCFSYQSLAHIARRYNEANPSDKIPISRNRADLWNAIKEKTPQCSNERCWTTASWLRSEDKSALVKEFKPPLPQGKNVWLNTDDINHVMDRYERIFPTFRFLGTFPIDIRSIDRGFREDLKRWLRSSKVKSIGLVLNLDEHDEPGSHWVSVYVDKTKRTVEYFDSFADETPDEVIDFYDDVKRYSSSKKRWKLLENTNTHQLQNSECGVYSIHFIVKRLSGSSFSKVVNDIIRDDKMNQNRRVFFDPNHTYDSMSEDSEY